MDVNGGNMDRRYPKEIHALEHTTVALCLHRALWENMYV